METPQQPGGPQSPAPGPQSPAPGPQSPAGGYGGPVPPGGWQQPPQPLVGGQLASWGTRAAAYVIDGLIVGIPAVVISSLLVFGAVVSDDASVVAFALGAMLSVIAFGVIALLYAPLLMIRGGARNGQTIGKQLLDIRAVRDNGQPWTFASAALREVVVKNLAVGIASSIIPFIPAFLNFFWPLWDDQNRALHDMAVSSHVVKA